MLPDRSDFSGSKHQPTAACDGHCCRTMHAIDLATDDLFDALAQLAIAWYEEDRSQEGDKTPKCLD